MNELRFLGKMESNELCDVAVKNKKKDWLKAILLLISMLIFIIAAYHVIEILLGPVFERQFESPTYESDKIILKTGRAVFDTFEGFMYSFLMPIVVILLIPSLREMSIRERKIYKKIGMAILSFIFLVWFALVFYPPYFIEPTYVTLVVDNSTQTIDIEGKPLLGDPHNRYVYFDEIDYIKYEHGWKDKWPPGCDLDRPIQTYYGSVLIYLQNGKFIEVSFGFGSGVESNRRLAQELSVAMDKELVSERVDRSNR